MDSPRPSSGIRVLLFGGYDRTRVSRIVAMAQGLSDHGLTVNECNVPLQFPHEARLRLVRRPWNIFHLFAALVRCWWALLGLSRHLPAPDVVLVPYPAQLDVLLARLRFPRATLAVDLMVFLGNTVEDRRGLAIVAWAAGLLDRLAIRVADLVVLDTAEHKALIPPRHHHKSVVVPVGAPQEWFRGEPTAEPRISGDPIRIIFFGLFTPLQGALTIADALVLLASKGVPFLATIVGTGQDSKEFDRRIDGLQCVTRIPWLDEKRLRLEVQTHDICLGIFGTTPKALRVVPQKVALGAACGTALVTSDTPPQRTLLQDAAIFVPPGEPVALAEELGRLSYAAGDVATMKSRASCIARERFSPLAITDSLVHRLKRSR